MSAGEAGPVSGFEDLLSANAAYAEHFAHAGLEGRAAAGVGIVTCMDARIPPLELLGLEPGDAKVLRSAGGRVTESAMTGLVLGVQLLGVRRILVIEHTRCAMASMTETQLRARLEEAGGQSVDDLPLAVIADQPTAVRDDVEAIRKNPLIGDEILVGGFLYDVDTGRLDQLA